MKKLAMIVVIMMVSTLLVEARENRIVYDKELTIATLVRVKEAMRLDPEMEAPYVIVFETQDRLDKKGAEFNMEKGKKAFYVYKSNTIYTSLNNLSMDILQHELCHAVLSHELKENLISSAVESWCQDIDQRLE